ncbi:MAG TPA: type II secretion system protein GspJ [Tepidisphaeraceae bacterium]
MTSQCEQNFLPTIRVTSRQKPRIAARSSGFTLIELLLALGMVAMLMLSLYVGMSTAFRARKSVGTQTDVMRQAKAALDLVEQDLRSILPPSGTFAGPFIAAPAGPKGATIECFSFGTDYARPEAATHDGLRRVLLSNVPEADATTLVRDVTRDMLGNSGNAAEQEILVRGLSGFTARYFDGSAWTDTWDSTQQNNALPLAAEVTVRIRRPTLSDPQAEYSMKRMIMLPCGLTIEQAAAVAAAAAGTAVPAGTADPATPPSPNGAS